MTPGIPILEGDYVTLTAKRLDRSTFTRTGRITKLVPYPGSYLVLTDEEDHDHVIIASQLKAITKQARP